MFKFITWCLALIGFGTLIVIAVVELTPVELQTTYNVGTTETKMMRVSNLGGMDNVVHADGSTETASLIRLTDVEGKHHYATDVDIKLLTRAIRVGDRAMVKIRYSKDVKFGGIYAPLSITITDLIPQDYIKRLEEEGQ